MCAIVYIWIGLDFERQSCFISNSTLCVETGDHSCWWYFNTNIIRHFYLVNDTAHLNWLIRIMNRTDQRILTDSQTRKILLIDFYRICYQKNNYLSLLEEYKAEVCAVRSSNWAGKGWWNRAIWFYVLLFRKNIINSGVSRLF